MTNHYETLQVYPNASPQEIKDAFRFQLFRYHPDHNRGKEEWAVQRTMELVEAYHVLSDPARRAHYDVLRSVRMREETPKKGFSLFGKGNDKADRAAPTFKGGIEKFKAGEYEQAIQLFRKTHGIDPGYPNVKFNVATCFLAIERLSDAMQWLQDHVARNKEDAEARALFSKIAALAHKRKASVV
jgi:predicted Zn-dependent protease